MAQHITSTTPLSSTDSTNITEKTNIWQVILASSAGTVIEWYDFYIFGSLATFIAAKFYPQGNDLVAYLSTLATFATGFIVRPFGALVFGRLGDLIGRKYTFLITMFLMGGATFVIGILPGYQTIGILAPIMLVLLRLLQGLALGGEYGGAATYVAEHSPDAKRGYYTSFIQTTATLGLFISIGVILITRLSLGDEDFKEWGWRLPFLLSLILVIGSYIIRARLKESPLFTKMKAEGKTSKNPLKESFANKENLKMVLLALFGATAGQGVVWYTGQFYALSFMEKVLKIDYLTCYTIVGVALVFATPFFVVFGSLSDRIGRKSIMMAGCLIAAVSYIPIYQAMHAFAGPIVEITAASTSADGTAIPSVMQAASPNVPILTLLVFIQVLFVTMVYGPIAAYLVELFPTRIRYTSMSLPYHVGNGVFGGLVPFIATYVVAETGNIYAGLAYPIGVAIITFIIGTLFVKDRRHVKITD
ncbi:MHS family MFS transporter [Rhodocytophaga rosea]|uniref:MHS family MFS transporter n=1 Tax=Rhodocytophaga rosea TaxID=2704465 RepID=A0A6C0GPN7_9BACT|nr:MFS transporter [Rhodocytophaga rosea]QHT70018.1 MHS family MFS transporter [Rhodocytophaga rosea]